MKRLTARIALFLILALGFSSHFVFSADSSAVRKLIEHRYQQMDHAATRLDLKGYTAFAAPDIVSVDDGQTFAGVDQFAKHLLEDFDATKKMYVFTSGIDQFSLADDVAKVDVTIHLVCDTADNEGKYGAKGAVHRFDIRMKFHNEWKQFSNKWWMTRFASVGVSGTVDGKPIPQPGQK